MKLDKIYKLVSLLLLFLCACTASEAYASNATFLTVVNPNNWGLDNTIAGIVAALGAYLVGLLTNKREKRKRKKDDLSNI